MPRHARLLVTLTSASVLAATVLTVTGPSRAAESGSDPGSAALSRLEGDASGALTLRSRPGGRLTFAGVPAGVNVDDPSVSSSTSVIDAAQSAVDRYGPAFGSTQPGTTLSRTSAASSVAGDVVRYQQRVGGVPVLGGEVVVSLRSDRQLDSILGETTSATSIRPATVTEDEARAVATQVFQRSEGRGAAPDVTSQGRWLLDPGLVDLSTSTGIRTAWRFELRLGEDQRRMVLVDDRTGSALLDADLIQEALNRIVCDNANEPQPPAAGNDQVPCTDPADPSARTEGEAPVGQADVDSAYDAAGAVSELYAALGVDLTALIGRELTGSGAGTRALAHTVRMCYVGLCPFQNAFWNGRQMYYGTGFARADDVVGHEMTHGVIERTSGLFYWGQSGAINESISDIMGEIVDHRFQLAGEAPDAWLFAEDWPAPFGPQRNLADPPALGDPDRTSSPNYLKETVFDFDFPYRDRDGVHTNSGVGNKTFYLASQGGTFNGQAITGIDGGDPTLMDSARLWLLANQRLTSGSDYADLAVVLEQACASLRDAGALTAADCTAVHQATVATELRATPLNNPQPADAAVACPGGGTVRTLFDGEAGNTGSNFVAGPNWSRAGIPGWGQNAHTGPAAWSNGANTPESSSSLVVANGIALPAGQASYLHFQHWRLLDYNDEGFHDAGTVEVNGLDMGRQSWVNGPSETINADFGNPAGGRQGFGGDSHGYVASRVDLSAFAGETVRPQFTMNTDFSLTYVGWYVDDVLVYTCDLPKLQGRAKIKGQPFVGRRLRAVAKGWTAGTTLTYRWLRNGDPIRAAKRPKYRLKRHDRGKRISVVISGTKPGFAPLVVKSKAKKIRRPPRAPQG
jgi:Zn-dependent metalloprotease